jgi:hypothetical protein
VSLRDEAKTELLMFVGWVNRHQLDVIDYLQEENRVLKERLGGHRIRFTDAERRRLARKACALGRKVLNDLETLVTPDTLLRWHRELVASKWNYSRRAWAGPAARREDDRRFHSAHGARESLVGIHANPRRARQSGTSGCEAPSPTSSEIRHRAGPGERPAHSMVKVSQGPLGVPDSDRFPER